MSEQSKGYTYQITMIGILFFILGFVTWLNSILIPYLRIACELTTFESYLVTFASYIAYFFTAIPSSWILKKTGLVNGMALALRSEEHTSELQSLMRISYAVFCLKKKTKSQKA